jgi:hypothetical protein
LSNLSIWSRVFLPHKCLGVGEGFGHPRGYFLRLSDSKIPHSLNPHSSRSSADACRASPRLSSNPSPLSQNTITRCIRIGLIVLRREREFRLLHDQYPLSIFALLPVAKYLATASNPYVSDI